MATMCVVILDHRNDIYLQDLIDGIRTFCPGADIAWYNSGDKAVAPHSAGAAVPLLPCSRPLRYAKVTPFFLDMFEWAAGQPHEYFVNAESDMAFVQPGYERFVAESMRAADYLAPGYELATPRTSRWRPYRSLRRELPELLTLLSMDHTNRCFSPGQVFSARYVERVLTSPNYDDLRAFVERNQGPDRSFSLQEVLLPTLAEALGLRVRGYPAHLASLNRYRPYHAATSVSRARRTPNAYFVHPIRRDEAHGARQLVRRLTRQIAASVEHV